MGATDNELCELGIGLLNEEGQPSFFWALLIPHQLITAWRGMHILDHTTSILHGAICQSYYAGMVDEESSDTKKAIAELSEQIPEIDTLRKNIFEMTIDDTALDTMLKICNSPDNGIDLSVNELKKAVEAGIIHQTTEVSRAYEIAVKEQLTMEHDKEISKQPLPEQKSFRKFCEKYSIKHLYCNPYDDWTGYWPIEHMDETLVYNGLRFNGTEEVWRAENPRHSLRTGHVGHPVLLLNDQRVVALLRVRFKDDDMWGAIHAVKSEEQSEWFTLSALSALSLQFVGLTFDHNDKPTTEDMARGYFAIRRHS